MTSRIPTKIPFKRNSKVSVSKGDGRKRGWMRRQQRMEGYEKGLFLDACSIVPRAVAVTTSVVAM